MSDAPLTQAELDVHVATMKDLRQGRVDVVWQFKNADTSERRRSEAKFLQHSGRTMLWLPEYNGKGTKKQFLSDMPCADVNYFNFVFEEKRRPRDEPDTPKHTGQMVDIDIEALFGPELPPPAVRAESSPSVVVQERGPSVLLLPAAIRAGPSISAPPVVAGQLEILPLCAAAQPTPTRESDHPALSQQALIAMQAEAMGTAIATALDNSRAATEAGGRDLRRMTNGDGLRTPTSIPTALSAAYPHIWLAKLATGDPLALVRQQWIAAWGAFKETYAVRPRTGGETLELNGLIAACGNTLSGNPPQSQEAWMEYFQPVFAVITMSVRIVYGEAIAIRARRKMNTDAHSNLIDFASVMTQADYWFNNQGNSEPLVGRGGGGRGRGGQAVWQADSFRGRGSDRGRGQAVRGRGEYGVTHNFHQVGTSNRARGGGRGVL
jgi:hypothetical protein